MVGLRPETHKQEPFTLRLMAEETKITLTYDGPSVKDGTFPIGDVIGALQGFSGAYNKIARLRSDAADHELRLSAIKTGSFELVIIAWVVLGQTPSAMQGLEVIYGATRWVIERIFSMVEIKKHTKNKPFEISVKGDGNTVVVVNADGAQLSVPPELIDFIHEKTLDSDLSKIMSPLEAGKVDKAELVAESSEHKPLREIVGSEEREFFQPVIIETTKDAEIVGKFVSLNKESNRGTFELPNGKHIPYRYTGPQPDRFPAQFARKGPARVKGSITFNENLEPMQVEVRSVEHLQRSLLDEG